MAYIGNIPAESYASFETQTFSTSATTSYTLSHAVTNENEIALFINSIRQQPGSGKSYTASGTTLTLSAATASSDTMYCVYLGRALQTVNPPNASVGADQLASSAVTTAKINASAVDNTKVASTIITGQTAETSVANDDLVLVSDTSASAALKKMTVSNLVANAGGGKIGQVLSATDETLRSTTSTSFVTASNTLSVDITPSATSSKIFITTDFSSGASTNNQVGQFTIYRDTTNLGNAEGMVKFASYVGGDNYFPIGMNYLDSPSSTSQLTYQVYLKVNTGTSYINYGAMKCSITVMEVLA